MTTTIYFKPEKETKNTYRFAEEVDKLEPIRIGSLYVSKSALKEMGWEEGKILKVEVSVND